MRQLRGAIVARLRERTAITVGELVRSTGRPAPDVVAVIDGLVNDGIVSAGPAALSGSPAGRVRLAS